MLKLKAIRPAIFKNRLSYSINANHIVYGLLNRAKHIAAVEGDERSKSITTRIKSDGYAIEKNLVPDELIKKIRAKADRIFAESQDVENRYQKAGLLTVKKCLQNIPECEELAFLPQVRKAVMNYYGGGYRLFHVQVYRTIAKEDGAASFSSDVWHFDNVPASLLKLMICLTDVKEESGAMRVVPKKYSHYARLRGFLKRQHRDKFEPGLTNQSIAMEGDPGTGIFFQPQYCIHKAVEPREKYRDVIVFMFYPLISGPRKLTEEEYNLIQNETGDYLINPFTGEAGF